MQDLCDLSLCLKPGSQASLAKPDPRVRGGYIHLNQTTHSELNYNSTVFTQHLRLRFVILKLPYLSEMISL